MSSIIPKYGADQDEGVNGSEGTQHYVQVGIMSYRGGFALVIGMALFVIGGLARTYMNILISRSPLSSESPFSSTELRYKRLRREHGAPAWPLVVTIILMPLGIILVFGAILWSK